MAEALVSMGVPPEAIIEENRSRNTWENVVNIQALLDDAGADDLILVTSALHMPRSLAIFRTQGLDPIPAPTDFLVTAADWEFFLRPDVEVQLFNLIPSADDLRLTSMALKELIGMAVYRLRGWA